MLELVRVARHLRRALLDLCHYLPGHLLKELMYVDARLEWLRLACRFFRKEQLAVFLRWRQERFDVFPLQ